MYAKFKCKFLREIEKIKLGKETKTKLSYTYSHFSFSEKCILVKQHSTDLMVKSRIYLTKINDISLATQTQLFIVKKLILIKLERK